MKCLICRKAEIVDGLTSVVFERAEIRLVVTDVPARVCPHCQEAYVDNEIALQLLRDAQELSQTGMRVGVIEFHKPPLNERFLRRGN